MPANPASGTDNPMMFIEQSQQIVPQEKKPADNGGLFENHESLIPKDLTFVHLELTNQGHQLLCLMGKIARSLRCLTGTLA